VAVVSPTIGQRAGLWYIRRLYGDNGGGISLNKDPLGRIGYCISEQFINKVCLQKDIKIDTVTYFQNYKCLYLHEDLKEYGYVDDTYNAEIENLLGIVKEYISENSLAVKYHPASSKCNRNLSVKNELCHYIPAEFYFNNNVEVYISVGSTALTNVTKGTAISLINLITFKEQRYKDIFVNYLDTLKQTNILFPKSVDEFRNMLSSICLTLSSEK
jgi:hypothetical protein